MAISSCPVGLIEGGIGPAEGVYVCTIGTEFEAFMNQELDPTFAMA